METAKTTNRVYEYAVVPGPGMYGDGQVWVCSRHHTQAAATRAAARMTRRHQDAMDAHGGSSGYYYAAEWGSDGTTFWADAPPQVAE